METAIFSLGLSPRQIQGFSPFKRWWITVIATAASTYALDFVATLCGLGLMASGFLAASSHMEALIFLAFSYAMWAAGLRVNLKENWALLEATGTSTNVLSKAALDITRLRTTNLRIQKFAAAAGYTAMEIAKEAPYYAGAFGAALFTDSISSNQAIVFLGGANLGAALYEYGLARLVRAFLRRSCSGTEKIKDEGDQADALN